MKMTRQTNPTWLLPILVVIVITYAVVDRSSMSTTFHPISEGEQVPGTSQLLAHGGHTPNFHAHTNGFKKDIGRAVETPQSMMAAGPNGQAIGKFLNGNLPTNGTGNATSWLSQTGAFSNAD
ncbi:MAG: hypothetical protein AB3N16_06815, partial [Flavobacteriaceae bacterium]